MSGQLMHMSYVMWLEHQMANGHIPSGPDPIPPEPEPIVLPPQTIRFRFASNDYDPTVIENDGVWTKVDDSSFNDWDWYCEDTSWESKFSRNSGPAFTEDVKVSILATGDMANITSAAGMFRNCAGLTSISENAFPNLEKGSSMFEGCTGLISISKNAFQNMTNGTAMFNGCTGLTNIPDNAFQSLTVCTAMFQKCTSLTSIAANTFPNLTNGTAMFNGCTGLSSIPVNAFQNLTNGNSMFIGCINVTEGALGLYRNLSQIGKVTIHYNMFKDCGKEQETGLEELQQIPQSWGGLAEG